MREDAKAKPGTWLSPPLREALAATLGAGEQAMLFLNRRGYAPLTLCEACGHKMTCPQLLGVAGGASLSQAAGSAIICGYETATPPRCPECGAEGTLIACGPGVERVAEEFAQSFPKRALPSRRPTRCTGRSETQAAIRAMAKREIDVLIGTQIVAKGHHFPQLTLVGVIDADLGGSDGDLRARERTFQLLHQVSGRAGRAEKPGLVLDADAQSRRRGDAGAWPAATATRSTNRSANSAKRAHAPPFGRLAAIILSGRDGDAVRAAGRAARQGRARGARRESMGPDAGLLCTAARTDARAAAGAGRTQRGCAEPICAHGLPP